MRNKLLILFATLIVGISSCGTKETPAKIYSEAEYLAAIHCRDSFTSVAYANAEALATARNDLAISDSSEKKLKKELSSANSQIVALQKKMENYRVTSTDKEGNERILTYQ